MKPILVDVSDLWQNANKSSLKDTSVAEAGSYTVYSINDFAINLITLIGEWGEEGSEITKTHTSTAPIGSTVTTVSGSPVKAHPKDTPVYIIPYDQIELSHSSTISGAKTVLITSTLNPENKEWRYEDVANSDGYYFTRYKNSIINTFSDYSDAIPYTGYESNTVGYIIYNAMEELGKEFNDRLTFESLLRKINACLRYIKGKLKRWSNTQEFDYIVGQLNRGENRIALPSTYYDKNSNKSMLALRIGNGTNLIYKDKREFNDMMKNIVHTQVSTEGAIGATTLVLDSTDDLSLTDGTVNVYVNGEVYTISYTTNTKSTNTLSGIPSSGTGSITATLPVDSNVWFNEQEGEVEYFSIWDGYIYFMRLISEEENGKNIIADFYTDIVEVNSETDIITDARYDMVDYWVRWEIRNVLDRNGLKDMKDNDFIMFNQILADAVRREASGQKFKMKPKLNGIFYGDESSDNFDRE